MRTFLLVAAIIAPTLLLSGCFFPAPGYYEGGYGYHGGYGHDYYRGYGRY